MNNRKLKTINEHLKGIVPHGNWCNQGARENWCEYLEMKNLGYYCNLMEEYVSRKECGINE